MEAWDETPPQAVSLHWIRNMVAGYFGIDTGDGSKAKPLPVTPEVVDWMQRELANMSGGVSQEVFRAVQEMETEVIDGRRK